MVSLLTNAKAAQCKFCQALQEPGCQGRTRCWARLNAGQCLRGVV